MHRIVSIACLTLVMLAMASPVLAHDGPTQPSHLRAVENYIPGSTDGTLGYDVYWCDPCSWGRGTHTGFHILIHGVPFAPDDAFDESYDVGPHVHHLSDFGVPGTYTISVAAVTNSHVGPYRTITFIVQGAP